jgi:DNA recombination protein RmuC
MTIWQDVVGPIWGEIVSGPWQDAALALAVLLSGLAVLLGLVALLRQGRVARRAAAGALAGIEDGLVRIERAARDEGRAGRAEAAAAGAQLRGEVQSSMAILSETVVRRLDAAKAESGLSAERLAERVSGSLRDFGRTNRDQMTQLFEIQKTQHADFAARMAELAAAQARAADALRATVGEQLGLLRSENAAKLDQMRATVDEKLQGTLEKRLGESFRLVSERLEAVHQGLGEMQTLAAGVGDLKRVLSNVKTRGAWGEVQLGALLDQILVPSQYLANAATGDGNERVEFAIRLPGRDEGAEVLLPIDAKFPVEDYERLQAAAEAADQQALAEAGRALEQRIRQCARDISTKYVNPPHTTDFAILFLPTEGLYAEVTRRPGLADAIQREHRVTIAGPSTLTALLNALQMGFRTLAIQQRSSEVWQVLGAVKTEFGKFGPVLEKVKKKLQEASNTIDQAGVRERAIQRRLRRIEAVPSMETAALLGHLEPPEPEGEAGDARGEDVDGAGLPDGLRAAE